MARHEDEDEFLSSDFHAAEEYIAEHPEFALCRVRHDVRIHEPPHDIDYHADGGWTMIYDCHGCHSEYRRRFMADGRYDTSTWKYANGYQAAEGVGHALVSRSGKAAFNTAHRDLMAGRMGRRNRGRGARS